MNYLIGKLLGWVGRRLDGYKTLIGGVGLILVGIAGLIGRMFPDQGLPAMEVGDALEAIASGVAVIGLGGKAEKIKSALTSAPVGP